MKFSGVIKPKSKAVITDAYDSSADEDVDDNAVSLNEKILDKRLRRNKVRHATYFLHLSVISYRAIQPEYLLQRGTSDPVWLPSKQIEVSH